MLEFPGNVLIIDDNVNLPLKYSDLEQVPDTGYNKTDYRFYKDILKYFDDNGIPVIKISDTENTTKIVKNIQKFQNVRLLILDLDLDCDNSIEPNDIDTIKLIISTAIEQYGYFFLLISSNHYSMWEREIREEVINSSEKAKDLILNLSNARNKIIDDENFIESLILENYSLRLISKFEYHLNKSRDIAFSDFIEFNNTTWQQLVSTIRCGDRNLGDHDLTNIFFNNIKQYLLDIAYADPKESTNPDPETLKRIFRRVNYSENIDGILEKQPIWTGNFYKTNLKDPGLQYGLIITPECDIANNKHIVYKVLFGFEINADTFSKYKKNDESEKIPLLPKRISPDGKYKSRSDINSFKKLNNSLDSLYTLPFIGGKSENVVLDFRFSCYRSESVIKKWNLISRINSPMIIDIIDKYSNLFNRKGLIDFPIKDLKLLD